MNYPNINQITKLITQTAICSAAGYVGAWFAAGPKPALKDPKVGAIMAVAARITYALAAQKIYDWTLQRYPDDKK